MTRSPVRSISRDSHAAASDKGKSFEITSMRSPVTYNVVSAVFLAPKAQRAPRITVLLGSEKVLRSSMLDGHINAELGWLALAAQFCDEGT